MKRLTRNRRLTAEEAEEEEFPGTKPSPILREIEALREQAHVAFLRSDWPAVQRITTQIIRQWDLYHRRAQ